MDSRRPASVAALVVRIGSRALLVTMLAAMGLAAVPCTDGGGTTPVGPEPSLGAPLTRQMTVLWRAITFNQPTIGSRIFFPRDAYLPMKADEIPDPATDYVDRLVALFDLDLAAYHRLVSSEGSPTLLRVVADARDAAWIAPGACENRIGYWHLPGVRLVYSAGGHVRSVGVFSLISTGGLWYVVHLGPNPRAVNVGTVDAPLAGPGTPGPAGGC